MYKVGDVVQLVDDENMITKNSLHRKFAGREVTIRNIRDDNYHISEEGNTWNVLHYQIVGLAKINNWKRHMRK